MTKVNIDEKLRAEWRELGFYYMNDIVAKEWRFFGDRKSIKNLSVIIDSYCDHPKKSGLSEHIHLGPYSYLKIMTWNSALITLNFIAGRMEDLRKLSALILEKTNETIVGHQFFIDEDYSIANEARLVFNIMPDKFDPVSMDEQLNQQE